jgi:hypothetical protein
MARVEFKFQQLVPRATINDFQVMVADPDYTYNQDLVDGVIWQSIAAHPSPIMRGGINCAGFAVANHNALLQWSASETYRDWASMYVGSFNFSTSYANRAECLHGGHYYRSLQGYNSNHQPDTSPTWWQDMGAWATTEWPEYARTRPLQAAAALIQPFGPDQWVRCHHNPAQGTVAAEANAGVGARINVTTGAMYSLHVNYTGDDGFNSYPTFSCLRWNGDGTTDELWSGGLINTLGSDYIIPFVLRVSGSNPVRIQGISQFSYEHLAWLENPGDTHQLTYPDPVSCKLLPPSAAPIRSEVYPDIPDPTSSDGTTCYKLFDITDASPKRLTSGQPGIVYGAFDIHDINRWAAGDDFGILSATAGTPSGGSVVLGGTRVPGSTITVTRR